MRTTAMVASVLGVCAATLGLLGGCASGSIEIANMNGVAYRVEGGAMSVNQMGEEVCIANDRAQFTVRGGRLMVPGREPVELRPGDRVLLARDGRVFVNGRAR